MERSQIAVVIPALNEGATISAVVKAATRFSTVIVVNDGSSDGTAAEAEQAGAVVINNATSRGYDQSLGAGFDEADKRGLRAVITMDGDGEHDPALVVKFAEALDRYPLVLGVRERYARLAELMMGFYVRQKFGVDDIFCGMKGYNLELLRENGGFDHSGSIGTELALNSIRRGHAFTQIQVYGKKREDQPRFGSSFRANLKILRVLARLLFSN